jgi:hypothetical protein
VFKRQIEAGPCVPAGDRRPPQPRSFEGWLVRRFGVGGRPRLVAAVALAAGLVALVLPAGAGAAPDCQTSGAETVCTFEYTGAAETWTVPYGVSQARFDVYGAQGGTSVKGPRAAAAAGRPRRSRSQPPTGKKMEFTGTTVIRVENGLITEEIGLDDGVTALKQLGLIPPE